MLTRFPSTRLICGGLQYDHLLCTCACVLMCLYTYLYIHVYISVYMFADWANLIYETKVLMMGR